MKTLILIAVLLGFLHVVDEVRTDFISLKTNHLSQIDR